jgi:YtoQ family protein
MTTWNIYLAGEVHTSWRDIIRGEIVAAGLEVRVFCPVTDHASSDNCGVQILGEESDEFWKDHKGAGLNSIRTRTLIERSDIVVVRFGDKYKQWNAAFDAGFAVALGKPLIVMHDPEHNHALKEIDRAAAAVVQTPEQVVEILRYVIEGRLS